MQSCWIAVSMVCLATSVSGTGFEKINFLIPCAISILKWNVLHEKATFVLIARVFSHDL